MKKAFHGLISKLDMAQKRISELEHILIELPKLENKDNKQTNKQGTEYLRTGEQLQKV